MSGYLSVVDSNGRPIPAEMLVTESEYEGATTGRRLSTWGTQSSGPNTGLYSSISNLRARTRQLIRNNPLIDGGADTLVADIIGSGITPRWQLDEADPLKKEIGELWDDWVLEADFYGLSDFYGLQSLVTRGLIDAGESLVRFMPLYAGENDTVPLQLQVLEADHLDESYNTIADNGNEVRMGIEIDKLTGRRAAYWLWKEHPGEYFLNADRVTRIRVPASECLHIFKPLRAGQMRGRPWLSSIILKTYEIDQYEDAELVRKKTAAMFGGFITETANELDPAGPFGDKKKKKNLGQVVALEPGTFPVLPPGMSVVFSEPADVGPNTEVWLKHQLREVAKGMDTTYEKLTGDLTGVSYSSIRSGLLDFRRRCEQLQLQILVFQLCRPVARRWLETAVASGVVSIPGYLANRRKYNRVIWRPDGWPWVDPVKDQLAEQMAVRNGFKSRSQVIMQNGGDPVKVDFEIAQDNKRSDDLGLVLDSDPRKTGSGGNFQNAANLSTLEKINQAIILEAIKTDGGGSNGAHA